MSFEMMVKEDVGRMMLLQACLFGLGFLPRQEAVTILWKEGSIVLVIWANHKSFLEFHGGEFIEPALLVRQLCFPGFKSFTSCGIHCGGGTLC